MGVPTGDPREVTRFCGRRQLGSGVRSHSGALGLDEGVRHERRGDLAEVHLYWIPLGAGGSGFVRFNGQVYEWFQAKSENRGRLDLYHTALEVHHQETRFVVETVWPSPDGDGQSRGVVLEGAVGAAALARWRTFRYEVRCWPNGILPDADEAVGGPRLVSRDPQEAMRVIEFARSLPRLIWGRDQSAIGEMWNSNSVISWLLTMSGMRVERIRPPDGGRAPGWDAGVAIAKASGSHTHLGPVARSSPKVTDEPVSGQIGCLVERAGFLE